jgi:hypothetical protein
MSASHIPIVLVGGLKAGFNLRLRFSGCRSGCLLSIDLHGKEIILKFM